MRIEHSSELTLHYKALMPVIFALGWAAVAVHAFREAETMSWNGVEGAAPAGVGWIVVAAGAFAFAHVLSLSGGMARVFVSGRHLILTGFSAEVRVPAEQVQHVTRWWWSRPGFVTLVLREPTPFGKHVSFVPPLSVLQFIGLGILDDSPARELRRWAAAQGAERGGRM